MGAVDRISGVFFEEARRHNVFTSSMLDRFSGMPAVLPLAGKLLGLTAENAEETAFLAKALPLLQAAATADSCALVRGERGVWRTLAASGVARALPEPLLAATLDCGATLARGSWAAAPIYERGALGELLIVHAESPPIRWEGGVDAMAAALAAALETVRQRQTQRRRIERLEAILSIAGQWNQTHEMETLLQQMAEASCRLLNAERASIFLWDRPNKLLIGRPALGVAGDELRISETTGVVGQVIATGEPRRVNAATDQHEIDRGVDKQLNFQTRTLLCVPLRSRDGELFGAFEMINKRRGDFTDDDEAALVELASHASIALENTQQMEQLFKARRQITEQAAAGVRLIGECPAIEALRSTVKRVAATDLAVLILGENGTGKEVVSQMLHYLSRRKNEPFLAVNCAAIAESLLESELFGHEKGAFTDARETRQGKFELASGGTLFLDEIGDMSLAGQAKMLRVLEEKTVIRVGGSQSIHTDARVIAATNQNLAEMVRQKKFREDLYFRLTVVTLELPPLRERGEDICLLAEHFLDTFSARARRKPPKLTVAAKKRLMSHAWPGNVRQLRNLMERLAFLTQEDKIDGDDLALILNPGKESVGSTLSLDEPLTIATDRFQADYIQKHIDAARGNVSDAARRLGLHRSNLYRKMKQLGMDTTAE